MTEGRLQRRGEVRESSVADEVGYRLEMVEGRVLPILTPTVPHQSVAHLVVQALRTSARRARLSAHGAVLLRLGPDRLLVPDLVVARVDRLADYVEAADTVMVGEVTRPGADYAGTPTRIELCAAAGIPWFLLTQPESPEHKAVSVRLFKLREGRYLEHASAGPGQLFVTKDPFPFRLRTADLVVF
ncbi:Uma2 family endonuclease [Actinoplanes sp. Pm04-4]|uniref:Uma2 family endonuclease n=1 Tax=Paractinoplanes pyxinae TaxID=2997416 RepID=A0ABT4B3Q8_9ACTN|nr:Uma2 family endonuclease [Actinoplanes pyxinae]MCY1141143.1 Uma2 family endonuclease [Actinoplanes pyxinae]